MIERLTPEREAAIRKSLSSVGILPETVLDDQRVCLAELDALRLTIAERDATIRQLREAVAKVWPIINRLRGELIDKDIDRKATANEAASLANLQEFADFWIDTTTPRQPEPGPTAAKERPMLKRFWNWLFGSPAAPQGERKKIVVVDEPPDAYRDAILAEVMATGGVVMGNIASNGDLIFTYEGGKTRRVTKAELFEQEE
jgi:hypothetical protein